MEFARWSATMPEQEKASAVTTTLDGVVMFLLKVRINQSLHISTFAAHVVIEIDSTFLMCRSPLGKLCVR